MSGLKKPENKIWPHLLEAESPKLLLSFPRTEGAGQGGVNALEDRRPQEVNYCGILAAGI